MHNTFEFYVRDVKRQGRFHVVTCPTEHVMDHARRLLDEHEAEEVEVRLAGQHLFTLAR